MTAEQFAAHLQHLLAQLGEAETATAERTPIALETFTQAEVEGALTKHFKGQP